MKKIMINGASLAGKEIYGVQRNALELLKELDHIVDKGRIQLLIPGYETETERLQFDNVEVKVIGKPGAGRGRLSKFRWNHLLFPLQVRKQKAIGIDMMLALPLWGCDGVYLCDCITERFPQNEKTFREKLWRNYYIIRAGRSIRRCQKIWTLSQYSKQDIIDYYHCSEEKISVIPCGWQHFQHIEADMSVMDRYCLNEKKYFFSLGSRYYHKNFRWVMEAAKQNPQYTFVITGSRTLNTSDRDIEEQNLNNLIFTGYLTDGEIKALMKNCRAFIQPSLYEGFGLPPMEAMSVGAKCIVSNASSLPEIYKNSVWYIDPLDYSGIDMDKIMETRIEPAEIILKNYSWRKSAELFWKELQSLL